MPPALPEGVSESPPVRTRLGYPRLSVERGDHSRLSQAFGPQPGYRALSRTLLDATHVVDTFYCRLLSSGGLPDLSNGLLRQCFLGHGSGTLS